MTGDVPDDADHLGRDERASDARLFGNLGHSNLILTAGGGAFGHIDGAAAGAASLRQAEQCWKEGADLLEFAKEHNEFARAFASFPQDADELYPGWREALRINAVA